jgi:hypothetical protein
MHTIQWQVLVGLPVPESEPFYQCKYIIIYLLYNNQLLDSPVTYAEPFWV